MKDRGKRFRNSFFASIVVGALGAFIFWGAFAGWFVGSEESIQLAAPAAAEKNN
jgi:hypothetical protein